MVIPCNPVAPPRWSIDGHWYCAMPKEQPCKAPKEFQLLWVSFPKSCKFCNEDFVTGLGGNIYSNAQIQQHKLAERVHYSREAQAIVGSYHANTKGDEGSDGIWQFGTRLSGETIVQIEESVLAKLSFLIPAAGSAWPWLTGIGLIVAMVQAAAGCVTRVYLVYQARGAGLWMIPAALGMAVTLLAIP